MDSSLSLFAGKSALNRIRNEGITPDMFSAFLGASGGPKWFVLSGLDKVIFNDFLDKSTNHIDIIGSSAGAFRTSCFAQDDPRGAITRLADKYSTMVYSEKPSVKEITDKGVELLDYMMGENGVSEVLNHPKKSVHIIAARCHGLVAKEAKWIQMAGLLVAAMRNASGRKQLAKSFTRAVFSSNQAGLNFSEKDVIKTEFVQLSEHNFLSSLMASGSIPAVIQGVENIAGAAPGMFRDGGIIDYHFDMQIQTPELVLYPHFYHKPIPGWFDKGLKSRCAHQDSYDNVLMIVPSDEFVDSLPYGKIPDRKDFENLPAQERIRYWVKVIKESDRIADDFLKLVNYENMANEVKPINLIR
jgi:hypothetical protein